MPAETTRILMKHGQTSATIAIPIEYRRYHHLDPGTKVRVLYDHLLLLIPPGAEEKARKREDLIKRLLE